MKSRPLSKMISHWNELESEQAGMRIFKIRLPSPLLHGWAVCDVKSWGAAATIFTRGGPKTDKC